MLTVTEQSKKNVRFQHFLIRDKNLYWLRKPEKLMYFIEDCLNYEDWHSIYLPSDIKKKFFNDVSLYD